MSEPGELARRARAGRLQAAARLGALGAIAVGVLAVLALTPLGDLLDKERITAALEPLGGWAMPLFVVVYAVLIALWVPGTVLTGAGSAVFGVAAVPLNYLGAVLGAFLGFVIARGVGGGALERLLGDRFPLYSRYRDWMSKRGFEAILYLRLVPTPYTLVSYVAGLSPMSVGRFTLATAVGIIPGSIAFSYLFVVVIDAARARDWATVFSARTFLALSLFATAALIPLAVKAARRRWGWFGGVEPEPDAR